MGKKKREKKQAKDRRRAAKRLNAWLSDNEISTEDLTIAGLGVAARSARKGKRKQFKRALKSGRKLAKTGVPLLGEASITSPSGTSPSETEAAGTADLPEPVVSYRHAGGGWYSIEVAGVEVDRLQGEHPAAERAGALLAAYAAQDARERQAAETGVRHMGGGWYDVRVAGVPIDRVRGKAAVEERFGSLTS